MAFPSGLVRHRSSFWTPRVLAIVIVVITSPGQRLQQHFSAADATTTTSVANATSGTVISATSTDSNSTSAQEQQQQPANATASTPISFCNDTPAHYQSESFPLYPGCSRGTLNGNFNAQPVILYFLRGTSNLVNFTVEWGEHPSVFAPVSVVANFDTLWAESSDNSTTYTIDEKSLKVYHTYTKNGTFYPIWRLDSSRKTCNEAWWNGTTFKCQESWIAQRRNEYTTSNSTSSGCGETGIQIVGNSCTSLRPPTLPPSTQLKSGGGGGSVSTGSAALAMTVLSFLLWMGL